MGYKAIIFDFEGTLVDFQWEMDKAVEAVRARLQKFGFNEEVFQDCDYAELFNKAMDMAESSGLSAERIREEIEEVYEEFDLDALTRWSLRDGSGYILKILKENEIPIALSLIHI